MYTVIGYPVTRTIRVLWALEEIGAAYELKPLMPASDETKAINPSGKVPVLLDGEFQLTDSCAILHYLSAKHDALLAPSGTQTRATQDAMVFRLMDELDALLWTMSRHSYVLPKDKRVAEIKPSLGWELNCNLDRLANEMSGPYLVGDSFSIADIIFSHCIGWAKNVKIEVTNQKILDHAKAMRSRPAFQRLLPLLK